MGRTARNCAQRYTDGKISLRDLLRDFLESFLNFDSRVFRTITALFLPGKLSIEYFRGRHQRYLSPLRLFFSLAVFHFAVLGFLGNSYIKYALVNYAYLFIFALFLVLTLVVSALVF